MPHSAMDAVLSGTFSQFNVYTAYRGRDEDTQGDIYTGNALDEVNRYEKEASDAIGHKYRGYISLLCN